MDDTYDTRFLRDRFEYRGGKLYKRDTGKPAAIRTRGRHSYVRMKWYARRNVISHGTNSPMEIPVHRIIFALTHGYLPKTVHRIDPDKGNTPDNLYDGDRYGAITHVRYPPTLEEEMAGSQGTQRYWFRDHSFRTLDEVRSYLDELEAGHG